MPRGHAIVKSMTCKQCGQTVTGKPYMMAQHVRLECKGKPKAGAAEPTPQQNLTSVVELIDQLDIATIQAELATLDRRRAALNILLDAAQARHRSAGG